MKNVIEKSSQADTGARWGAGIGALGGGALALVLSTVYYNRKNKKNNKQSFASRFLKGALWTALGAAGGGVLGAGIGRAIGLHVRYRRNVNEAKAEAAKKKPAPARALYVNWSDNKYPIAHRFGKDSLASSLLPKEVTIGHSAVLVMDKDGGNAKVIHQGPINQNDMWRRGWAVIREGIKKHDMGMVQQGYSMTGGNEHIEMWEENLGDALKGKDDAYIARYMADYGELQNMGATADMFEGGEVDRNFVDAFAKISNRSYNAAGTGKGYGFMPGGDNCGTGAREIIDAANDSGLSHFLDLTWGGTPNANAPSTFRKITGKSYKVEKRDNMFPKRMPVSIGNVPPGWREMAP